MGECEEDARTAARWWRSKWDYTNLLSDLVEMKLALRMGGYISKSGRRTKKWDEDFDKLVENALDTQQSIIIRIFLNSPQFKKQYANREELVEEMRKALPGPDDKPSDRTEGFDTGLIFCMNIIKNHGLEE